MKNKIMVMCVLAFLFQARAQETNDAPELPSVTPPVQAVDPLGKPRVRALNLVASSSLAELKAIDTNADFNAGIGIFYAKRPEAQAKVFYEHKISAATNEVQFRYITDALSKTNSP